MKTKHFYMLCLAIFCIIITSFSSLAATKNTRTVTWVKSYYSLAGIQVAEHRATTWFTYDGTYLYNPNGVSTDYSATWLNYCTGTSQGWDWYNTIYHGTGRSWSQARFKFGLPTPWGPIGGNYSSTIRTSVDCTGANSAM